MNFVSLVRSASAKWRQTALTVALLLLAGCGREEIRVYTAPKDNSATATAITVRPRPIARPKLEWQLPAGWTDTGPGKMNIASFVIAGATGQEAQVTITPLMLVAGREVMIVNMMREQVGLEAMSDEEAQKQFQPVEVGGEKGSLFELSGTPEGSPPKRIVTAIVHRSDSSLFYKLAGDTALVEAQKPVFLEFLKSIRIKSKP